jgi:tetratricopeptide (TPR) repeat protein
MGVVLVVRYEYARAAEEFRESLRLERDNALVWMELAWAQSYQQPADAKGAEQAAREAIRLQPTMFTAYYQLGRALLLQGRYTEAIETFRYSLTLNPQYSSPHIGLGQVYLAQGKYDQALAELKLAERTGISPVMVVQRASVYAVKGDKEKALSELTRALDAGYRDFAYLDSSPYLASLRSDPRYQVLMRRYRK